MILLSFGTYEIELENDSTFKINSSDNIFNYDFVYHDKEAEILSIEQSRN